MPSLECLKHGYQVDIVKYIQCHLNPATEAHGPPTPEHTESDNADIPWIIHTFSSPLFPP